MRISLVTALICLCASHAALARNTPYHLKIAEALNSEEAQQKLGSDVAFYFAGQPTPSFAQTLGTFVVYGKVGSAGISDETACRSALIAALAALKTATQRAGGNATVDIVSDYKKRKVFSSATEYECHAGSFVAGVELRGSAIKTN